MISSEAMGYAIVLVRHGLHPAGRRQLRARRRISRRLSGVAVAGSAEARAHGSLFGAAVCLVADRRSRSSASVVTVPAAAHGLTSTPLLRVEIDDPADRPPADAAEPDPVAREHDAVGLAGDRGRAPRTPRLRTRRPCPSTSSPPRNFSSHVALLAEERVHLRLRARCARGSRAAAPGSRGCVVSNASFSHGVGSGVPGVTRSRHFSVPDRASAVTFGSHGSGCSACRPVS